MYRDASFMFALLLIGSSQLGSIINVAEVTNKDYRVIRLSDCCANGDEEVHRVLTTKIFTRQADVFELEDWRKL